MAEFDSAKSKRGISKQRRNVYILIIIGVSSLLIRLLMSYEFDRSALLYVGIPFLIAIALTSIMEQLDPKASISRFYAHIGLWSLVVLLATSIILFEGFICVVMFMPIYFGIIFISYLVHLSSAKLSKHDKSKHYAHVLPVIVFMSAFEGVVPSMSFEREYSVTRELVVAQSIEEIKYQLTQPMELNVERNWLLSLFPMPRGVDNGSLKAGAIHRVNFVYHRWFVTNTHDGDMVLELSEVESNHIRTRFIEDTSYISNYLKLRGTEVDFVSIPEGGTKIVLTIHYHRFLDPAWYFGPLQEYAIGETASLLLEELFSTKNS